MPKNMKWECVLRQGYFIKDKNGFRIDIKCILQNLSRAIVDFEECIVLYGNNYTMDHTYGFYIAISYLQLNEYIKAENI
jgi:hypothetical protein